MLNLKYATLFSCFLLFATSTAGQIAVKIDTKTTFQTIDGFGCHQSGASVNDIWLTDLYYNDLAASIFRVDLTPKLGPPYSDLSYFSPWFMGSATNSVFNLEDPDNPNGPENNRVRTYTHPGDYSRLFGGLKAPIAVMGADIEANIGKFTYSKNALVTLGKMKKAALGDFKLVGSLWSPVPWVKKSSGNTYNQNWWPGPVQGSPWPFIWGGNFAGGKLDISDVPLPVFFDGVENTSALTQFARSTAAYISGFQKFHQVEFYALSIQNELNFEQFYNSATYPLSVEYMTAVKKIRAEFDKYPDLKNIKIMGPEDLLGGDAYGLWQYGGGNNTVHKNLQYLQNIENEPLSAAAVDFYCIHGYASDGVQSAGAAPQLWNWWANGWAASPAPGIPANVKGFTAFNKKSWMTETSGENPAWLFPGTGFPNDGGFSIGLKIHQAFTAGNQSAWIYWTFSESENGNVTNFALTNQASGNQSPKYVAAKHYFKYIRPNAVRVQCSSTSNDIWASAYLQASDKKLTTVLLNASAQEKTVALDVGSPNMNGNVAVFLSQQGNYWAESSPVVNNGKLSVVLPGYSIATIYADFLGTSAQHELSEIAGVQIFPSPAQDEVTLQIDMQSAGTIGISLFSSEGKKVLNVADPVNLLPGRHVFRPDISHLPPGTYFLRIENKEGFISRVMVKG